MKYARVSIAICILSLFVLNAYSEDTEEKFPKIGYVKNNGAIVRAGDNANFEALCSLEESDSVKITDKRYSWFRILLPRKAYLYISKDYVNLTSDEKGIGIVNATNVNLRAGPGTRYSILGQVSKPEKLYIISEENNWYKIEPPYGSTGWINASQVSLAEEESVKYSEPRETEGQKRIPVAQKKESTSANIRLNTGQFTPKGNLIISTSQDTRNR